MIDILTMEFMRNALLAGLLASIGALVAMLITLGLNMYLQKDFAREWSRSLEVKHP